MNSKHFEILNLLDIANYSTSQEIAENLGLSEKTVRTRIKELNQILSSFGANVESKRHFGYRLVINNANKFASLATKQSESSIPETTEERQQAILKLLLETNDYIKIDELTERYFISRNTISNNLKRVEEILNYYDLKLERKPNYGIKLVGSEFNIRTCLVKNFFESLTELVDVNWLTQLIVDGNRRHQVNMSEISLENFVKIVIVSLSRIKAGYVLKFKQTISNEISSATQLIVVEYAERITEHVGIHLSQDERRFLAVHFGAHLSSDSYSQYGPNFVITSKIDELVFKMLSSVYETFAINFLNNLELRMALNQHMVPMDIRMRYNIPANNPLTTTIQRQYPYPYTLAITACLPLRKYYAHNIPEDEIAFIALIFALATERRNRPIKKKNIVIVCVSGTSSSQLFSFKYKQAFGNYIENIYECSTNDLDNFDFKGHSIDYIFTTIPLKNKYAVPVFEISLFIDNQDILTYSNMFEKGDKSQLLSYYSPNLFLTDLKAETKEEVLKMMCKHIAYYDILPEGFYESVLKRESLGQTDFGNRVAVPHPHKVLSEQSFVCVAILEKPIIWQYYEVQVVFLLSIGKRDDPNLEEFYQKTSSLFFDKSSIERLINEPKFETLLDILN